MRQPVQGKIYAVSDRHQEISIEQEDGSGRLIIQPEQWDYSLMCMLLNRQMTVFAKGMEASGLPLLMRAKVKYIEWEDEGGRGVNIAP